MTTILLGNTGRGGEQCVFSCIVDAYRRNNPDSHITVAVCPEFLPYWTNNRLINATIGLEHHDQNKPHFMDPVGKWYSLSKDYDIVEFACEYGLDVPCGYGPRAVVDNIYDRLTKKPCSKDELIRKPHFTPTDDELKAANDIIAEYGSELLVISPVSNTACPVITLTDYERLASVMLEYCPVATTGDHRAPLLTNTVDLRCISMMTLYALSFKLNRFIGPDTATSWMVTKMPGRLITIRGDNTFPVENTGLIINGFRESFDTLEIDVNGKSVDQIIETCKDFLS